jgi:hypothetical protein
VGGDRSVDVGGASVINVGGADARYVRGDASRYVEGDDRAETRGASRAHVHGPSATRVEGPMRVETASDFSAQIDGDHELVVGTHGAGSSSSTFVYGDHTVSASGHVHLRADAGITLTCGDTSLKLTPDTILALAATLHMVGTDQAFLAGKKQSLHLEDSADLLAEKVLIVSKGGSLELTDSEAKLGGQSVKLGKPKSASSEQDRAPDEETKSVRWKLLDGQGRPYAGKNFHLLVSGRRYEGTTDGDGFLAATIPKDARRARVILWTGEYPTGPQRRYDLLIADELPDPMTSHGACVRLHALGYDVGLRSPDPWPLIQHAVHEFQTRYREAERLTVNGRLDEATMQAIQRVFGS